MFEAYAQKHGAYGLQGAISSGQYTHPDGIFFGGSKPTWSNRTIRAIARAELGRARDASAIIDFHTGLGPFGHGELICAVPPSAKSFPRAKAWYGDEMTSPEGGTSTSAVVVGDHDRRLPAGAARRRGHADRHRVRHLLRCPRCWARCAPTTGCIIAATSARRWAASSRPT